MAANYAQLEKMLLARYKCTSVDISQRLYKGRDDIVDVIKSIADMNQCKELFEKHKHLAEIRDGEAYKASIGNGGAIDLLKKVVANWIQQDLFVRSLGKKGIGCELTKYHRDRDFNGCLSVEPTAILWAGEPRKSKYRLIDVQIAYGASMNDGYVALKKEKLLKLIERKALLLTMNMTTLKYNIIDFMTNDTVSEEYVMGGGLHVIKVAMKESKSTLNEMKMIFDHLKNIIENTIGAEAGKFDGQVNYIALYELENGGKDKKVVKTYSIPEGAEEKRKEAEKTKEEPKAAEEPPKKEEPKQEVKKEEVKPKEEPKVEPKPQSKPQQKPQPKPQPKPKPQPPPPPPQEEEDNGGYDFSAVDGFA